MPSSSPPLRAALAAVVTLLLIAASGGPVARAADDGAPLHDVGPSDLLNELPVWLKATCPRKDPNANDCLTRVFSGMFPYLANGLPEVAIPSFEPLQVDSLSLQRGGGAVSIIGTFKDLFVEGPSNSTADFVRLDEGRRRLEFGITFPYMRVQSHYDLRGHILVLPLVGSGRVLMHLRNVTTSARARVQFRRVGDREVLHATHMAIDFDVGRLSMHMDGLFGGNNALGATLNAFLNQHSQQVVSDLKEPVGEALSTLFLDIINRLFHRVPLDLWLT